MNSICRVILFLLLTQPVFGAITQATLASNNSSADQTSYTTASQTPTANRLVLATIASSTGSATANQPTLTGNGLTWVAVQSRAGLGATNIGRITVFRAMGSSPSAGTVVIDFAGQTQTSCLWNFSEFAGVDTSGTNGSGAVVQSAQNGATSGTSLTVTLAAFGSATNATFGAFAHTAFEGMTAGSGFTEISDWSASDPIQVQAEWKNSSDTGVDASWTTSTYNAGIALEIKEPSVVLSQRRRRQ